MYVCLRGGNGSVIDGMCQKAYVVSMNIAVVYVCIRYRLQAAG